MSSRIIGKYLSKMKKDDIVEGVFAVNKPSGISSAQALRVLQDSFNPSKLFAPWIEAERISRAQESKHQRRRRRDKKIQVKLGHGGTLDPLATGVLITGIGRGTKSLQDFLMCTKEYEAIVLFGTNTDTYDRVGKVLKRAPYKHITRQIVEEALNNFRGKFMQLPPLFSALKMNGKPLYEYAREGKEIPREIEKRPVEVLKLELVEWMEGGSHSHKPPTDEAGYLEVNVANQVWTQAGIKQNHNLQESTDKAEDNSENQKAFNNLDTLLTEETINVKNETKTDDTNIISVLETEVMVKQEESVPDNSNLHSNKRKFNNFQNSFDCNDSNTQENNKKNTPFKGKDNDNSDDAAHASTTTSEVKHEYISENQDQGQPPAARLRMTVTSGFYVRSLCHDLGVAVKSAALMAELKRTRQGDFTVSENTLEFSDLEKGEEVWGPKVRSWLQDWNEKHPFSS